MSLFDKDMQELLALRKLCKKQEKDRDELLAALKLPIILYALGYISEFAGDGGDHTEEDGRKANRAAKTIRALLDKHAPKAKP
jgi:hypothetical protein